MYALNGRVALVTGAGGGIGREIARRLTREGMAVAVLDRDGREVDPDRPRFRTR
jgi:NAD(P)-dependent dehydrogenase (short-subunit alcohol dehydrogenase family)